MMIEKVVIEVPAEDYNFLMSTLQYIKDALNQSRFDGFVAKDDAKIIYKDVGELLTMLEVNPRRVYAPVYEMRPDSNRRKKGRSR